MAGLRGNTTIRKRECTVCILFSEKEVPVLEGFRHQKRFTDCCRPHTFLVISATRYANERLID